MTQYVLVNRRAGKFTTEAKTASRAAVATTLARLGGNSRVVSDRDPADETARRVVVFDADAAQVAHLRTRLPADAILEPLVRRTLHRRTPIELAAASPMNGVALGGAASTYRHRGHVLHSRPKRSYRRHDRHHRQAGAREDRLAAGEHLVLRRTDSLLGFLDHAGRSPAVR